MTKRVIITVPEGLTFETLTEEQQAAINGVFGQYVLPMIGTVPANGKVLCDALTADSFDPSHIPLLGLPFEVIGIVHDDGTIVQPLDEATFLTYLPPVSVYDEDGNTISTQPPVLHEPHSFGGQAHFVDNNY